MTALAVSALIAIVLVVAAEIIGRRHERRIVLDRIAEAERQGNSYKEGPTLTRPIKTLLMLFAVLVAAGCAPFNPATMSAEQLNAFGKIKDATVTCIIANTPYGKGSGLYINLDKGVITSGTVTIDDACKTTITNGGATAKP